MKKDRHPHLNKWPRLSSGEEGEAASPSPSGKGAAHAHLLYPEKGRKGEDYLQHTHPLGTPLPFWEQVSAQLQKETGQVEGLDSPLSTLEGRTLP